MDSYTNAHFQPPPDVEPAANSSSTTATSVADMSLEPKAEASASQDMAIKRETSDDLDGDTSMADIPASAGTDSGISSSQLKTSEPRSSQPPGAIPTTSTQNGMPSDEPQSKPTAASRAAKKKGTATLVKKTTNRKPGAGTRGGRGARRGGKSATPSSVFRPGRNGGTGSSAASATASSPAPGTGSSDVEGGAGSDGDGEESDHGPYCLCRGPDDHRWMISCDVCEDWFHGECVNIDKTVGEALIQRYVCPRCTDDEGINTTRYKKTCSLDGCFSPARIYDGVVGRRRSGAGGENYSVFCSDKHAEDWWEQLVKSLPENGKRKAKDADLTREKFMGLLNVSKAPQSVEGEEPWSIGKKPFAVPSEFWSKVDHEVVLTPEEQSFLSASAADRYALAEEIVLNKKMQQLLDLANERRKAAISIGLVDKDTCGYDMRLDLVGCPVEFAQFVRSAQGEAIYRANSLAGESTWTEEQLRAMRQRLAEAEGHAAGDVRSRDVNMATAGMCDRRRCKPHASWYNIFTKSTRHIIKELARQAKEKLDAETRVREAAATRYFRRRHERTAVTRLDGMVAT